MQRNNVCEPSHPVFHCFQKPLGDGDEDRERHYTHRSISLPFHLPHPSSSLHLRISDPDDGWTACKHVLLPPMPHFHPRRSAGAFPVWPNFLKLHHSQSLSGNWFRSKGLTSQNRSPRLSAQTRSAYIASISQQIESRWHSPIWTYPRKFCRWAKQSPNFLFTTKVVRQKHLHLCLPLKWSKPKK